MADPEHLRILELGLFVWNRWREDEAGAKPDLRRAALRGLDLCGYLLHGADLWQADLRGATLDGATLDGAGLRGSYLSGADLKGTRLQGADLREADLRGCDLRGADLRRALCARADLEQANLEEADLRAADLTGVVLRGARLKRARLEKALLEEAILDEAELEEADLREVVAPGASFLRARLKATLLDGARLPRARLQGARLRHTSLEGADLSEADLSQAELDDCVLKDAVTKGAQWKGAQIDPSTYAASGWTPEDLGGLARHGAAITFPEGTEGLSLYFREPLTPFQRFAVEAVLFATLGPDARAELVELRPAGEGMLVRLTAQSREDLHRLGDAFWEKVWQGAAFAKLTHAESRDLLRASNLGATLDHLRARLDAVALWAVQSNIREMAEGAIGADKKDVVLVHTWPNRLVDNVQGWIRRQALSKTRER